MPVKKLQVAELVNGRAAMIGCSAVGIFFLALKAKLIETTLSQDFQTIWWTLGIYSGS